MLNIFSLGSCRVIKPLIALHSTNRINFMNIDYSWYAHNTKEYLQRIKSHTGEKIIPCEYEKLILDFDSCKTDEIAYPPLLEADLGIFEISSRYAKHSDSYWLHSTCLRKQNFDNYKNYTLSNDELSSDIKRIASYFKKVLIVCNIACNESLDSFDLKRVDLNNILKSICAGIDGVDIFDPNKLISIENPNRLINDRNHFNFRSEYVTSEIADEYYKVISSL